MTGGAIRKLRKFFVQTGENVISTFREEYPQGNSQVEIKVKSQVEMSETIEFENVQARAAPYPTEGCCCNFADVKAKS